MSYCEKAKRWQIWTPKPDGEYHGEYQSAIQKGIKRLAMVMPQMSSNLGWTLLATQKGAASFEDN
jgi:hypothetical protein